MIHKKINDIAQLTSDTINRTGDLIKANVEDLTQYHIITISLFCKTVTSFYANWILCKNGFGQDALVIVRTMMENSVTLVYINLDPTTLIPLYANHEWVKAYKRLEDFNLLYPNKQKENQITDNILDNYNRVKNDYPKKNSWSGKTILDMAIECDLEDYYYMVYRLGSVYTHSGSDSLSDYIQINDSKYDFRLGERSKDKTDLSLITACSWVMISIQEVCRALALEPPEHCQSVLKEINNITSQEEIDF